MEGSNYMICKFIADKRNFVELYEDKIIISFNFPTENYQKEIYLDSLAGIQIQKPGFGKYGYIKFLIKGSQETKLKTKTFSKLYDDENTLVFSGQKKYQEALQFKNKIEEAKQYAQNIKHTAQQPNFSVADELLKYKQLKDNGVISEDEFIREKNRLLSNNATTNNTANNTFTPKKPKQPMNNSSYPKNNTNIPQKTKKKFPLWAKILIGIIAFSFVMSIITSTQESNTNTNTDNTSQSVEQSNATSLSDIQNWYESQTSAVESALVDTAAGYGLDNVDVDEIKFNFGEDSCWYDCHYTLYFTCKADGVPCTG